MCGIAGYVGGDRKTLLDMLSAISHRGPDDQGIFIDGNIGLGNNRLSIIDLSKHGHQPLFNEDKSLCIVYNGEIYNFKDLRKSLERKHEFSSQTDSEVVLHAYEEWGHECLQKLNGMFAFVIYDRKKKLLFGARDRLGEKPLKYYLDSGVFAFASELKGLLPIIKNKELDINAIDDYMTLQYVPAPKTGLKNVYKLPAGHYFLYSGGKLQVKEYWKIDFSKKLKLKEEEWEELIYSKIKESVESRTVSDVPIGAFLSGGLDSSAVVALLSATNSKLKTFSIGFEDPRFDESKYALQIAALYNTDHTSLIIGHKELTQEFLKLPEYYDEPFADNSSIPSIILSRLARKSVKVALSGDGGDENFGGYERYSVVDFAKHYDKIPAVAKTLLKHSGNIFSKIYPSKISEKAAIFTKFASIPFYKKYVYYNSFFTNEAKREIYSNKVQKELELNDTFNIFKNIYRNNLSELDNAFNIDINSYLPEDLLYKMDIASMSASLEVRAPLLNHELLELTSQMPDSLKVRLLKKKYIFKKLLKNKKLLPDNIINRQKKGFVIPVDTWLKGDLKEYIREEVATTKMKNLQLFSGNKLDSYLTDFFGGKIKNSNNIFALLSLSAWVNKYL
ncbi:MAG: asparagine synthase (glutamine-hydrolysing) [Microgenomates group bacterium Gr01-1014_5]|nr:MAG: asparagine synthase (glutamine-hydrolysing) [Microgenomates group bacterium Gr01-1014_5]